MDTVAMKEQIRTYFREHHAAIRQEILALLGEMVQQKTVNVITEKLKEFPYLQMRGEEYRVGAIVKREFDRWGIPYQVFARVEGRPNVIATVGSGVNEKKLFMACHMDVVPPGDDWDSDPFVMTQKGDFVYGRGVLDNKGPLVSSMIAAKVMKTVLGDAAIEGQLMVGALADEEATDPDGVDYGIQYLLEEHFIAPTYAIIPDIGENMKKIDVAEKGRVVIKVIARGKQAHGSTPDLGINAIVKLARFIVALDEYTLRFKPDPVLIKPTVNLGEIIGGAAPNIVPAECKAYYDFRLLPGQSSQSLVQELTELSKTIAPDFGFEVMAASEPHKIDPDNELVRSIQANTQAELGFMPVPFGLGGGTFAKTLNLEGIKAVGFGPGDDTAFHVSNEFVEIKQLVDFSCLICLVALDLL